jgi:hypothetical protein
LQEGYGKLSRIAKVQADGVYGQHQNPPNGIKKWRQKASNWLMLFDAF